MVSDNSMFTDEYFMKIALQEAVAALEKDEVPVGCIIVSNNRVIARSHNLTETLNDVTAHAEMLAITSASNYLGSKYLSECTLFVTLEPCTMCAGALYWTQMMKLVYGASDVQRGFSLSKSQVLHPKTTVVKGVKKEECKALVDDFFKRIRE